MHCTQSITCENSISVLLYKYVYEVVILKTESTLGKTLEITIFQLLKI